MANFTQSHFLPGEVWSDDAGIPINAHGGGFLHHEGITYWYGEHKTAGIEGNVAASPNPLPPVRLQSNRLN